MSIKLDYANPKRPGPPFCGKAVTSFVLAGLGMALLLPPVLAAVWHVVGRLTIVPVLAAPIAGFWLGARADESFRCASKFIQRGSRIAEAGMLLNVLVMAVAVVFAMALVGRAL